MFKLNYFKITLSFLFDLRSYHAMPICILSIIYIRNNRSCLQAEEKDEERRVKIGTEVKTRERKEGRWKLCW